MSYANTGHSDVEANLATDLANIVAELRAFSDHVGDVATWLENAGRDVGYQATRDPKVQQVVWAMDNHESAPIYP